MSEHDFNFRGLLPARMTLPVAASELIERGNFVGFDSAGRAVEGDTIAGGCLSAAGRALYKADNSAGSAGAINVEVELGVFEWINSSGDPVTAADVGKVVFMESEATIAKTSSSGTLPVAGILTELTAEGLAAVFTAPWVSDLARAVAEADAGVSLQKRSLHLTTANVTAAATSQVINIGAALPDNARILGCDVRLAVVAGTITGPVTIKVGSAGDDDAILASANLSSAAVDGEASTHTAGIAPNKLFATATQLTCTVTSASGNLSTTTGLDATVDVLFAVLA